jgi:hypothetical protein
MAILWIGCEIVYKKNYKRKKKEKREKGVFMINLDRHFHNLIFLSPFLSFFPSQCIIEAEARVELPHAIYSCVI